VETFETATLLTRESENRYSWVVPEGWQQGRGAWGGLVVGALIKAVEASEPDPERTVRSVAANLVAPAVAGQQVIQTRIVRRGSAVSTWTSTIVDGHGSIVAASTVVLGAPRTVSGDPDYASWAMLTAPTVAPPETMSRLDFGPPLGPVFARHIAPRLVSGAPTESGRPVTSGWIDYLNPVQPCAASLIALVDAWWPAGLVALDRTHPIATVTFAANLLIDPSSLALGEPLLHQAYVSAAMQGYTSEHRRLWTADGRLAVDNLQCIVLIA
jgi:hypothetical protein